MYEATRTTRIDWQLAASFTSVPPAEIVRLRLDGAGVPTCLENAELVTMAWHYANAVGHVKLLVPRSELARAKDCLQPTPATCPSCGAEVEPDFTCAHCGWTTGDVTDRELDADPPRLLFARLRSARRFWLGWCAAYPNVLALLVAAVAGVFAFGSAAVESPWIVLALIGVLCAAIVVCGRVQHHFDSPEQALRDETDWSVGDRVLVRDEADAAKAWAGVLLAVREESVEVRADDDGRSYRDIDVSDLLRPK